MSVIPAALSLCAMLCGPQQPDAGKAKAPGATELAALRLAVREFFLAEVRYNNSGGKERPQLGVARQQAKDELNDAVSAWEQRTQRKLVSDVDAMVAAFSLAGTPPDPTEKQLGVVTLQGGPRDRSQGD